MDDTLEGLDPVAALAAIEDTRAAALERMDAVSWPYDLTYSALAGVLVAAQGLSSAATLADAAVICGLAALMRWHRARTGVWISGMAPGRARWVALGVGFVALLATIGVAIEARLGRGWIGLPAGLAMAVVALAGSKLWRRVYRREVAEGGMPTPAYGGGRMGAGLWLVVALGAAVCAAGGGMLLGHMDVYVSAMVGGVGVGLIAAPLIKAGFTRLGA